MSISTVSKSLNAPARVRPVTRQGVMAAVDELGFVPAPKHSPVPARVSGASAWSPR